MAWMTSVPVRFGWIDEAGIVYYPRIYEALHEAFEDFWSHLGRPYPEVLHGDGVGYPSVHIESDFRGPLRYGDSLCVELEVASIGRRSVVWTYRGRRGPEGPIAMEASVTTACVDVASFSSREVPEEHRHLLEPHLMSAG